MSYYDGGYKGGRGSKGGSGDGHRKIFVGGLSRDTSDDDLRDYFSSFGSVVECMVKRDPNTGQSRGFGFVTFQDSACVDRVVADRNHVLNGKTIDPKRAQARGGVEACRKIFVGGLDPNLPEDAIRDYFGKFGKIDLVEQPMDREKGIKKGFCFITFDSGDAVDMICVNSKHNLGGRDVDVKKATPKDKMAPNQNSRGGGMGGRGGGRGGRDGGYGGSWGDSGSQPPYAGYPTAYPDYSAYYAQMGYGSYGQAPQASAYPAADPYSQQYAAAAAAPPQSSTYDYSAWYGPPVPQPVGPVAAQNGGGAVYGSSGDRRYKPY